MSEWSFGGSELTVAGDYKAWAISGALDIPPTRGDNINIPFTHGATWLKKYYGQQTITLAIAVMGTTLADLEGNINTLLGILAPGTAQGTLTHIRAGAGGTISALAEVKPPIDMVQHGPELAMCAVDFVVNQPAPNGTPLKW